MLDSVISAEWSGPNVGFIIHDVQLLSVLPCDGYILPWYGISSQYRWYLLVYIAHRLILTNTLIWPSGGNTYLHMILDLQELKVSHAQTSAEQKKVLDCWSEDYQPVYCEWKVFGIELTGQARSEKKQICGLYLVEKWLSGDVYNIISSQIIWIHAISSGVTHCKSWA